MRSAGKLPTEEQAHRFADYLLTKKVPARVEAENGEFAIWIHEEDQLSEARRELDAFREEPNHERYVNVARQAQSIRRNQQKQADETRKRMNEMRQQWNRPTTQQRPLTIALILISIAVSIFSSFGDFRNSAVARTLLFVDPLAYVNASFDLGEAADPMSAEVLQAKLISVKKGEVWRTITPIFIHYDPAHLIFNMIMLYQLGGLIERQFGTVRFGLLVLVIALLSTGPTAVMPYRLVIPFNEASGPMVGGMSGVIFGLAGYLWAKSMVEPMMHYQLNPMFILILLGWLVLGVSGILDSLLGGAISNWGHLLGLIVGFVIPYIGAALGGGKR